MGYALGKCTKTTFCGGPFRIGDSENENETSSLSIYPNPISNSATIAFFLLEAETVKLQLFDITGKLIQVVADGNYIEGDNEFAWDASRVTAGFYYMRIEAGGYTEMEKISVVK